MWEFGEVAVLAINLIQTGKQPTPRSAWDAAADQFLATASLREKNCPRAAFLSLCQEGWFEGVPAGEYTRARENRAYTLEAVRRLVREPELVARGPEQLWELVLGNTETAHNGQMHVVLTLWERGLILVDRVTMGG